MAPVAPKLPPLPPTVFTVLGPVVVSRVDKVVDDEGKPTTHYGYADYDARTIQVRKRISPQTAWSTLFHEQIHMILHDAGVLLPSRLEEDVCNAVSLARVAEMTASHTP